MVRATALALTLLVFTSPAAQAQKRAKPVFKDGEAQVVDAFKDKKDWIQHDLWVETEFDSDGDGALDRMHVDVTRPGQTESGLEVPVIYESSPYYCGTGKLGKDYFWDPSHELGEEPPPHKNQPDIPHQSKRPIMSSSHISDWVPRGFAVVHSASPGTGLSDGCPTVGGINESLAPKAVVDWLCGRAKGYTTPDGEEQVEAFWSTGKVGMTGTSYNGTLPLACATTGVEGLEAIIPVAPNTSYYHYYRCNGLVRHPGGYMGEDVDVLYDFINSGDPARREWCNENVRDKEIRANLNRTTGDWSEWWAARDYKTALEPLKAAVLMAHAFNDWNVMPEHGIRIYEAVRDKGVPSQLFMHQRGHGGPPPFSQMNRWFTHYLYGVENGVEDDPKSWIVREEDKNSEPTPYAAWPHPKAVFVSLHLAGDGNKVGSLTPKAPGEQGVAKLIDDVSFTGKQLAQAEESRNRLLYSTSELKTDLHISGHARLKLRVAADKPAANLSVWLVSLPWTDSRRITDNLITRGWADPQNHRSISSSEPLSKGGFVDVEFTLQPDDQVIREGQRIGLMVFSSDRDFTLWPDPGTQLSIDLGATVFQLPVVGGARALKKAIR